MYRVPEISKSNLLFGAGWLCGCVIAAAEPSMEGVVYGSLVAAVSYLVSELL